MPWNLVTSHCTEKISACFACLHAGSVSAERVGQGEVGGVTRKVLCTCWLLGLAVREPWLGLGRPPPILTAWTGLENTTLTLVEGWFLAKKAAWSLRLCMATNSADCCMLVIEWVWSKSQVCLLMMGSVLESELIQKWRYHTFT